MPRRRLLLLLALFAAALPAAAQGQPRSLELILDPAATQIRFTLKATFHTVHGSFRLQQGRVRYDPQSGAASGLVVVAAASGQTGNADRDATMQRKVLESAQYPEITFRPTRVTGALPGPGRYTAEVEGILHLHGADHVMTVPVSVDATADRLTARASVLIPYVRWGLKDPSTFFLHVAKQAQFELVLVGRLQYAD